MPNHFVHPTARSALRITHTLGHKKPSGIRNAGGRPFPRSTDHGTRKKGAVDDHVDKGVSEHTQRQKSGDLTTMNIDPIARWATWPPASSHQLDQKTAAGHEPRGLTQKVVLSSGRDHTRDPVTSGNMATRPS